MTDDSKKKQLGKLFDQYDDDNVTGVYLRLSPRHEELPETEEYKVSIFVAVGDSSARNFIKEQGQKLLMQLDLFFKPLIGVSLVEKQVLPEGQITLSMLRDYDLWSPEYHSFKSYPEGIPPVDLDG